jgi:hypothetical protein
VQFLNSVIGYLDPYSKLRTTRPEAFAKKKGAPPNPLLQYLAMVAGIAAQPFLAAYRQNGTWDLNGLGSRLVFALIVGVVIFPQLYKNAFDPTKPWFVQLCADFGLGLGWESAFGAAVKAAEKLQG